MPEALWAARPCGVGPQAGVDVFVPGLPFATSTSDTGVYVLNGVPEGPLSVAASHPGFASQRLDGLTLQPGELLTLAPLTLAPSALVTALLSGSIEMPPPPARSAR